MVRGESQSQSKLDTNKFYRDYYSQLILFSMVLSGVMMLIIGILFYELYTQPLPNFQAEQPNDKRMELTPFTEPNLRADTLLKWASKAATIAYTFDFVNYAAQLEAMRPYFTEDGWRDFYNVIDGPIRDARAKQLFVNGIVTGMPIIKNQGPLPGKGYSWRIQIPFLVTYRSANSERSLSYYIVMTLVPVPTYINPQGIGIDQFLMV